MIECMVAAPQSGGGKTVMTCALLAALKQRGHTVCAFKCGPDYIDPMFHRAVLGIQSHNLDLFLSDETTVQHLYGRYTQGCDAAVCEGVMGLYDGVGGTTTRASAWHLADVLDLPVLLVLRPKGASLTLAATVRGLNEFRTHSHLVGILLNDCKPMLYQMLAPMLERETGLPVLGYLPPMEEAQLESRHLGLYTAGEIEDLQERIHALAQQACKTLDLPRLEELCARPRRTEEPTPPMTSAVPIAVAQDEAFCFCYAETLDALRQAGAKPVFFSPLRDTDLPSGCTGAVSSGRISGIACSQAQSEPGHAYCGTKGGVQRDADGGGVRRFSVPGTGPGICGGHSVAYDRGSAGTGTPHSAAGAVRIRGTHRQGGQPVVPCGRKRAGT